MKRRIFAGGAFAAALTIGHVAAQNPLKPSPVDEQEPGAIELADDLVLTSYQFMADNFDVWFFGEVENVSDAPFDAQAVAVTFLDDRGDVLETIYPIPIASVLLPGQRIPLSNTFSEFNPLEDEWSELTASICGEHPKYDYTEQLEQADLQIEDLSEDKQDHSYRAEGVIHNRGDADAQAVDVYAIYRDTDDRLIAYSRQWLDDPIPAGEKAEFSVGADLETLASPMLDPFAIIDGPYTVELIVAIGRPSGYVIECA